MDDVLGAHFLHFCRWVQEERVLYGIFVKYDLKHRRLSTSVNDNVSVLVESER